MNRAATAAQGAAVSKSAAIAIARGCCAIWGRRTSWTVCGPYYVGNPRGPSTEVNVDSYPKAVACRTRWRARIVLALMGLLDVDAECEIDHVLDDPYADHSLRALVDAGLAGRSRSWGSAP